MSTLPDILTEDVQHVPINRVRQHPANPREGDVGAIWESIQENGFFGALVVQESSGCILAGNHRWMAAKEAGMNEVPVIYVDVGDERAMRILLADNRTNDVATYDGEQLADLLEHLASTDDGLAGTGYDGDALDELLDDLERGPGADVEGANDVPPLPDLPPLTEGLEIPVLEASMQPEEIPAQFVMWGDQARTTNADAIAFYTQDYKFEGLFNNPLQPGKRAETLVEPNFSTNEATPMPVFLHDLFSKRAMSRWWADRGSSIIVDMNVVPRFWGVALEGVPEVWQWFAFRAHDGDDESLYHRLNQFLTEQQSVKPMLFFFGGGRDMKKLCKKEQWVWVPEKMDIHNSRFEKSIYNYHG